ncbi:bifunctional riboflavin kinase/FAD synthetase [Parvicella tangerina]|uniref:Riboflavin biosynthesis protein n=1 Tax=Parvicella tangerina TaxID=2829795 RepID=A0A916JJM4_9FLAO|nr:bifunctional riboflavin kinase/FAD synthetase [Parvicella tangerina]CAG5076324.1 Bifunctional riboflavin kinase/FMN adenylyltransferase [Parvicella tangerina]
MIIHKSINEIGEIKNPILTVGTFDGVHVGHQKIISRINELAQEKNGESVLLTFHPHPRKVLFPDDDSLKLINTIEEKTALLEQFGLDHVIYMAFEKSLSRMSPVEYVRDILVNKIGIKTIVIGYDHHFGRNREGDIELLRELGPIYDFEVVEITAQDIDEITVSSTKVRRAIEKGDIKIANEFLGHPFCMTGTVVAGAKLGRELGYPTANLQVNDINKIIPGNGVYEVIVQTKENRFTGMLNIGTKPTVADSDETSIEVHLLDFNADLYGQELTLTFIRKIRDEQKFDDLTALKNQLSKDEESVRRR